MDATTESHDNFNDLKEAKIVAISRGLNWLLHLTTLSRIRVTSSVVRLGL
jgi:hypothetical protein